MPGRICQTFPGIVLLVKVLFGLRAVRSTILSFNLRDDFNRFVSLYKTRSGLFSEIIFGLSLPTHHSELRWAFYANGTGRSTVSVNVLNHKTES